jgi:COMPASS component SWD3
MSSFSPKWLFDKYRRIWDAETGQCLKTLVDDDNPIWYIVLMYYLPFLTSSSTHVRFTPNSKFVLVSTQDSTIRLWNYQTSRCVKTYTGHANRTFCIPACFKGKYIISGSEDHKLYIWDLQSREVVQILDGHRDVVLAMDVSDFISRLASPERTQVHPKKNMIASAAMDRDLQIRIWSESE